MIYHLIQYLSSKFDFPGSGLMQYLTFRAILGTVTAILIAMCFGMPVIRKLRSGRKMEEQRKLGVSGENLKEGVPSMGGLLIIMAIIIPILLFGNLANIYNILLILTTLWLGLLGYLDDFLKIHGKEIRAAGRGILYRISEKPSCPTDKGGLSGWFKIFGQVLLGLIVASVACFHPDIASPDGLFTTIPFVKGNEFNYAWLIPGSGPVSSILEFILYIVVIVFVITAVSNGANLTDGKDGLCAGISAIVAATLGILAYLSGNVIYSNYLNIMYLPQTGEVAIFMAVVTGALLGFLWFNSYPAQIFMGDTGSLCLGGIIAVASILIKKELLLPILCGVFLIEALSVIIQRFWFKYTKRKYGQGRRVFRMTPLHHHFEKQGIEAALMKPAAPHHEAKIVMRFWLVGLILAVLTIITLKIR